MTDEEAAALWADYFVFTVMRDPFDRAVSGYHWLMRTVAPEPMECRTLVGGGRGVAGHWSGSARVLGWSLCIWRASRSCLLRAPAPAADGLGHVLRQPAVHQPDVRGAVRVLQRGGHVVPAAVSGAKRWPLACAVAGRGSCGLVLQGLEFTLSVPCTPSFAATWSRGHAPWQQAAGEL